MTTAAPRFRLALLLALLPAGLPQTAALATPTEERFTPAPLPSVALPRLTPRAAVAIQPTLTPPPQIAPPLSATRVPGTPPKISPVKAVPVVDASDPPPPPPSTERPPSPPPVTKTVVAAPPPESPVAQPLPAATAVDKVESATVDPQRVVTTAGVYVRATPSGKGRVLDALDPGERLDVIDRTGDGWVRVGRKGKSLGYISAAHLANVPQGREGKIDAPVAQPAPAPASYAKAAPGDRGCALPDDTSPSRNRTALPVGTHARATAAANLRVAPACDAKVADVLDDGERVTIQAVVGSWYKITRRNRSPGYVGIALLAPTTDR